MWGYFRYYYHLTPILLPWEFNPEIFNVNSSYHTKLLGICFTNCHYCQVGYFSCLNSRVLVIVLTELKLKNTMPILNVSRHALIKMVMAREVSFLLQPAIMGSENLFNY